MAFEGPITPESLHRTLLPGAACLRAVRDTLVPLRMAGLNDAVRAAAGRPTHPELVLEAIWESSSCLELAANVAAPWVDPQLRPDSGPWGEMVVYDGGRATRFYESSHKWGATSAEVLSAHAIGPNGSLPLIDVFERMGLRDRALLSAMRKAEAATARHMLDVLKYLATSWNQLRGLANSFEHGLVSAPPSIGVVTDSTDAPIEGAFVTWLAKGEQLATLSPDQMAGALSVATDSGRLALDLARHFADARLFGFHGLDIEAGTWRFHESFSAPFPHWVRRDDLTSEERSLLLAFSVAVRPDPR